MNTQVRNTLDATPQSHNTATRTVTADFADFQRMIATCCDGSSTSHLL